MIGEYEPVGVAECKSTDRCENNACFFRMRDQFGYPIFWYNGINKDAEKAMKKAGVDKVIFPKLSVLIGTNVIYLNCEDKK